jgi:GNAT superfamily N-acetyltransferase
MDVIDMRIVIRPTTRADTARLPAIEVAAGQSFLAIPGLEWIANDSVMSAKGHEALLATDYCFVAEIDDRIIGFIATQIAGSALHIEEIAVDPAWQRHGIGRDLIMAVIAAAKRDRLTHVTLTTFCDVPWNAPFYARLGFVTLDPADCDARLTAILHAETFNGLPAERRCAMQFDVIAELQPHS